MATKIILGKRPESFSKPVKFILLDGSEGVINATYKYRTRSEFAELFDKMTEGKKNTPKSLADVTDAVLSNHSEWMLEILSGWDLDCELNAETAKQLADEVPSACVALIDAYRIAINEGRLGN